MAERVVLATLDFDERGALRGVKAIEQGIGALERQTSTTASVFTQRMFSMKNAATAFLGGFTVAGAALGFKNFIVDVFRAQENFGRFSQSLETTKKNTLQLIGDLTGINKALDDTATILDRINATSAVVKQKGEDAGPLGVVGRVLWGMTPIGKIETLLGLTAKVVGQAGTPATALPYPPNLNQPTGRAPGATAYDLAGRPFAPMATRVDEGVNIKDFAYVDELREKIDALTSSKLHLDEALANMPDALKDYLLKGVEEATPALKDMTAEFEAASAGAQAFGSAISSAMFQAGTSLNEAMGDAMMSLAQTMTAYALASLAIGAIASTPWGFAIFGPPAQYFHAAAVFGVAAAGAFAAASALGARRGGGAVGSAAGAAGGAAGAPPGGGNNYEINVTVEGNSNPEMFGRRAALSIKRALADGAAGGSF